MSKIFKQKPWKATNSYSMQMKASTSMLTTFASKFQLSTKHETTARFKETKVEPAEISTKLCLLASAQVPVPVTFEAKPGPTPRKSHPIFTELRRRQHFYNPDSFPVPSK